jgi:hypothetical protein
MFEENLNHVCEALKEHKALRLGFSDLSGKGIDRSRKYISNVAGWTTPKNTNWQELKKVQTIRNLLAHSAGYISDESSGEIQKIVDESNHLTVECLARNRIILGSEYLENCRLSIESYLSELFRLNESRDAI